MRFRKDATGTLVTYPPREPSTVTAEIYTPSTPSESISVTEDTVATTLSAAVSEGAFLIPVASATGIVAGRKYRAGDQTVEVESISGTDLTLKEPITGTVASGAEFVGLAFTVSLTTSHTSLEGFGKVRWTSDLDVWDQSFEIRTQTADAYTLSAPALLARASIVQDLRDPDDTNFARAIEGGWIRLRRDLLAQGIDLSLIRSWFELEDAHACATALNMVINSPRFDDDTREVWESEYLIAKQSALASREFWYDLDDDGSKDPGDKQVHRVSWAR